MNGIYHVNFSSLQGNFGEGLAVFDEGKINGGDHGYLYRGTYQISNSQVIAKIKVCRWNPAVPSIFGGIEIFDLDLSGTLQSPSFSVTGSVLQNPNLRITVSGKRLADLAS